MLLPPGPEQSWLIITLRRCWAQPSELASSMHMNPSQNLLRFVMWVPGKTSPFLGSPFSGTGHSL